MNLKTALIIVVIMIAIGILYGGNINKPPTTTPTDPTWSNPAIPTAPTTSHPTSTPPVEGTTDEERHPVSTPSHDGGEDPTWELPADDLTTALTTTTTFITGWLHPDPATRRAQLAPITAATLVDSLAAHDLRVWDTHPDTAPVVVETSPTAVMTRQLFVDGRSVDVLLVLDPGTTTGWTVTDIAPTP